MTDAERDNLLADLSAYVDGELSDERRREVEQWLVTSLEARQTLAQLQAVASGLRNLPRQRVPRDLATPLAQAVQQRALKGGGASFQRRWTIRWLGPGIAAAAGLIACVIVTHQLLQNRGMMPPAPAGMPLAHDAVREAAPASAAPEARRDEYARETVAGDAASPAAPEPAVLRALADRGVHAGDARANVARGQAMPQLGDAETPDLDFVLTPRDADEYQAAAAILTEWARRDQEGWPVPAPPVPAGPVAAVTMAGAPVVEPRAAGAPPARVEFASRIAPRELTDYLNRLTEKLGSTSNVQMYSRTTDPRVSELTDALAQLTGVAPAGVARAEVAQPAAAGKAARGRSADPKEGERVRHMAPAGGAARSAPGRGGGGAPGAADTSALREGEVRRSVTAEEAASQPTAAERVAVRVVLLPPEGASSQPATQPTTSAPAGAAAGTK